VKKKTNWPPLIVASGVTAVWQFHDIAAAGKFPQYNLN